MFPHQLFQENEKINKVIFLIQSKIEVFYMK
jgi:hypothetical protein